MTLRRLLVEPGRSPISLGASCHWHQLVTMAIPSLTILEERSGNDYPLSPQELLKEAAEIYYRENKFIVPPHLLDDLLNNSIPNSRLDMCVAPMIKNIAVTIDLRRQEAKDGGTQMAQQLRALMKCVGVEVMVIRLDGDGALNLSDFATQKTIQLIARVVRELHTHYSHRLTVVKTCKEDSMDIISYWRMPDSQTKRKFDEGNPSIEDTMRVQIHGWAGGR